MSWSTDAEVQWVLPSEGGPNIYGPAVDIVCKGSGVATVVTPYFTPAQLVQVLSDAGDSVTCLTDVDFLDGNLVGATEGQLSTIRGLAANGQLRSISPLHAKVLLKGDRAIVGSANITTSGLGRNIESAVLLRGRVVEPLRLWVDELWRKSHPIDPAKIRLTEAARRARLENKIPRSPSDWKVNPFPSPTLENATGWGNLVAKLQLDAVSAQQVRNLLAHAIDSVGIDEGRDSSVAFNWRSTDERASLSVGAALALRLGRHDGTWDIELCVLQDAEPVAPFGRWFEFSGKREGITTWRGDCQDLVLSPTVLDAWTKGLRQLAIVEGGAKSPHNQPGRESLKGSWLFRL